MAHGFLTYGSMTHGSWTYGSLAYGALQLLLVTLLLQTTAVGGSRTVTIRNDKPRRDIHGDYVDAHDGKIVEHGGVYYLYGEAYGNQTLAEPYPWKHYPRLKVYTSTDLTAWTLRGDPLPMVPGTLWIPNVIYHAKTQRFIMWFGAGNWGTATSTDGVHFTPANLHFSGRSLPGVTEPSTDGTGIFVDDDGVGYVAYATMPAFDEPGVPWPGQHGPPHSDGAHGYGHLVSIERLTDDLLNSSRVNVSSFFPDDFVESPSLFKRKNWYI